MRTGTSHSQIRNAKDPFAVAVYGLINTKPAITYESQFIRVCSKGARIFLGLRPTCSMASRRYPCNGDVYNVPIL